MTTFKDIRGNTIHIGQEVVYSRGGRSHHFDTHRVLGFTKHRVTIGWSLKGKNTVLQREVYGNVRADSLVAIPYENAPTVVCAIIPLGEGRVLGVKRANEPQAGKVALPGGYQMKGELWQKALCREVREETGYELAPAGFSIWGNVETDEYGNNLIVALYNPVADTKLDGSVVYRLANTEPVMSPDGKVVLKKAWMPDGEVLEVLTISPPPYRDEWSPDWAFPRHMDAVDAYWKKTGVFFKKLDGVR